jgi:putative endonuclease
MAVGTDARRGLGELGEELAAQYLERNGTQILARGARTNAGEIDVVAFDGSALIFVEVKALRVSARAERDPLEGIDIRKRLRLRRAGAAWLYENSHPRARHVRFDAIGVLVDGRGRVHALEHIRDAF